jgi:hypothetical protein
MLRTLVATLVVEAAMVALLFLARLPGPALLAWYRQLGPSAFAMDVLSVYVCVHVASLLVGDHHPLVLPCVVLGIQTAHDLAFGSVIASVPEGTMRVLDLFRAYARPAILGYDAAIVLSVLAVDRLVLTRVPDEVHAVVGAVAAYVALLFVHSF